MFNSCVHRLLQRSKALLHVLAIAVIVLVLVSPAWGQDEIKIGVIMPITGREAKPGQYQREGIELAIKQINDGGGILIKSRGKKLPIKEVFYDDGSDQSRSAGMAERAMSSDGVVAVIGGYSTALGALAGPSMRWWPPPSMNRLIAN